MLTISYLFHILEESGLVRNSNHLRVVCIIATLVLRILKFQRAYKVLQEVQTCTLIANFLCLTDIYRRKNSLIFLVGQSGSTKLVYAQLQLSHGFAHIQRACIRAPSSSTSQFQLLLQLHKPANIKKN